MVERDNKVAGVNPPGSARMSEAEVGVGGGGGGRGAGNNLVFFAVGVDEGTFTISACFHVSVVSRLETFVLFRFE